ncbi:MAG: hypothetical protein GXY08_14340 [Ruminococcus sp.]|nr:hypothetical protein [Ruminococcus sp.]
MKNDYEMYKSVLSRRYEYRRKKAGRIRMIKCTVPIVACFSFAVILGLSHWNSPEKLKDAPASQNMIEEPVNTSPVTTVSSQHGYTIVTTTEHNAADKAVSTTAADGDTQKVYTTIMTQSGNVNTRITITVPAVNGSGKTVTTADGRKTVTVTTALPDDTQLIDDERSNNMNKTANTVALFLSGVMIASAPKNIVANAEFNYFSGPNISYDYRLDTYNNELRIDDYNYGDLEKIFEPIENGEIDVDFNSDGVVDITDARLLCWANFDELGRRLKKGQTGDYEYWSLSEILESEDVKNLEVDKPAEFLQLLRYRFLGWWSSCDGISSYFAYEPDSSADTSDIRLLHWSVQHPEYTYIKKDDKNYAEYRVANLEITPEIIEKLIEKGDINGDGIKFNDSTLLITYLIHRDGVSFDYLCPSYFYPDGITAEELENIGYWTAESDFCQWYMYCVRKLYAGYPVIEELIDSGRINLDINANGELDPYDYLAFNVFAHEINLRYNYSDSFTEIYEDAYTILPEEERAHIFDVYVRTIPIICEIDQIKMYIDAYFASHLNLQPELFEDSYYEALMPGYAEPRIDPNNGSKNYINCHPGVELETAAGRMGIVTDRYSATYGVEPDILKEAFTNYYIAVKEGRMPEPDVDMDGEVGYCEWSKIEHYIDCNYRKMIPSGKETYGWDLDVWNNIAENCDYSQNGVSGDMYDYYCAWFYYELTYYEAVMAEEAKYNASDISAKSFDAGIMPDQAYDLLSDCDIDRSGDADGDYQMKMNDSVLIMQSISNADKYQLTAQGRFNADVNNTGDGITPGDALEVQRKLLGLA